MQEETNRCFKSLKSTNDTCTINVALSFLEAKIKRLKKEISSVTHHLFSDDSSQIYLRDNFPGTNRNNLSGRSLSFSNMVSLKIQIQFKWVLLVNLCSMNGLD